MLTTYLALLRGVNVGGKNKILMKDLVGMFVEAGCQSVRSYIQSGNVVFRADSAIASQLPELISGKIKDRLGHRPPIVLRTEEELRDVLANNPFPVETADREILYVMFLADFPDSSQVENLDPDRSPPDIFLVRGREVYLQLRSGAADTKLTNAYFDSKLATISTARNWRTVRKLVEMMEI